MQDSSAPSLPLADGRHIACVADDHQLTFTLGGAPLLQVRRDGECLVAVEHYPGDLEQALWAACYWLFAHDPGLRRLHWRGLDAGRPGLAAALRSGLLYAAEPGWTSERQAFWQIPAPWLRQLPGYGYPQQPLISAGKRHPRRAPKPFGELYRRFDARLQAWVSLRTLDVDSDLSRFNRWQNNPRVEAFWQEGGSLEQHRDYLHKLAADPHSLTLIGCLDDEPFAYFEAYWAREDRIAPFYEVGDYDRGIHMLVGEEHHRGPHKVAAWLAALVHWLFLDDPRTQYVVAEPRADNARMIGYLQAAGFYREKEFDFPHKRAALMRISREVFFDQAGLC
ncbi:GNAT family N-acetyltransferase [Pseudomonas sp. HR96]|uniref:GNAT family N-acetyltransferase n=1 Tax=Pseudomonas sp. HR96 TaxID=1027966 RepID=UPI002A758363|nr:GNAT family N-acetyltransferase [Pseudomonas sp. HR96]WPP02032.1 GNAT family N-acetyltransferase [Pseudomonas sp. HR96]